MEALANMKSRAARSPFLRATVGPVYRSLKTSWSPVRRSWRSLRSAAIDGTGNQVRTFLDAAGDATVSVIGDNNRILLEARCSLKGYRILIKGSNNTIRVGSDTALTDGLIQVIGDENDIVIGNRCTLLSFDLTEVGTRNSINIGARTTTSDALFTACESTSISIGEDCMFASAVFVQTSDQHSILDADGRRTNPARDIVIGDHVWACYGVRIQKGASIAAHSVVAAASIVTKEFSEPNIVLGGVPAKQLRSGVTWSREMLS